MDLISGLLVYDPTRRLSALEALAHPFFNELRMPGARLPGGVPMPAVDDWILGELDGAPGRVRAVLDPRKRAGKSGEATSAHR